MSDIELLYGRGKLAVTLPPGAQPTIVRKTELPTIADEATAVREALDHPVGAPALSQLAQGRSNACIVICDITRPVPNNLFLRPMIETMIAAGIPADQITILVATGLHRPGDEAEVSEIVGDPWVREQVRVVNHNARDRDSLVNLGTTPTRGTPVWIDRLLVDADLRIVTGLVEPHFMAGWSGGRKVISPGVAGEDTIRWFHSALFMEDPAATSCNLDGNPLHEEQLEIARMIGELYALNTVIDEDRNLSYVTFGDIQASHLAAVDFVKDYAIVDVDKKFHTIVTSSAGYPLDKTYYQTVKGMVTPMDILVPGGTIIMTSECSEGLGSPDFRESQRKLVALGAEGFLQTLLAKNRAEVDEWETEMQLKPMRLGNIVLYTTGLSAEEREITGVELTDSLTDAIAASIARSNDPAIAVIPEGPYVIPRYAPAA